MRNGTVVSNVSDNFAISYVDVFMPSLLLHGEPADESYVLCGG
jgi:hypothetical protein